MPLPQPAPGSFTIGRSPDCDIVLGDESVSRHHADLNITSAGEVVLTDRRSTHGTHLLDRGCWRPVARQIVPADATVRFGALTIAVAELLEAAHGLPRRDAERAAAMQTPRVPPRPVAPAAPDGRGERQLVRCACGAVKTKGEPCAECRE